MKHRIFTLLAIFATCIATRAQQVATLEALPLAGANTYWNGSGTVTQVTTFADGNLQFVNSYDTSFGGYWGACAYSNVVDTVTAGYSNQYAAITGKGNNNSTIYGVAYYDYNTANNKIRVADTALSSYAYGVYITNSTVAYMSLKNGDFVAKKFGGTSGNDPDFFAVQFTGWRNGLALTDTVTKYLADFRDSNNANDYIVKDWRWVDLTTLGKFDSIIFSFISSDVGQFGINTPLYFCFDDFTTGNAPTTIAHSGAEGSLSNYPNPATNFLFVQDVRGVKLYNQMGQELKLPFIVSNTATVFDISTLAPGFYFARAAALTSTFTKQ
jgi:hypothetical protein